MFASPYVVLTMVLLVDPCFSEFGSCVEYGILVFLEQFFEVSFIVFCNGTIDFCSFSRVFENEWQFRCWWGTISLISSDFLLISRAFFRFAIGVVSFVVSTLYCSFCVLFHCPNNLLTCICSH